MPTINLTSSERLISTARTWELQRLKIRKHRITAEPIESWDFYRNYTSLESALTSALGLQSMRIYVKLSKRLKMRWQALAKL